jgi:sn-glycerol 3-phosphate transport system substrate-binding protein
MILHVGMMSSWVRSGLFSYFGRNKEAGQKFASGECAMLTGSSGSIMDLRSKAKFDVGVAPLPVHEDFAKGGTSAVPRGGNLWVMAGKKAPEYVGVARFFEYLSRADVQAQWHQATGYLPTVQAAIELSRKQGFYDRQPDVSVAVNEMHGTALVPGVRKTSVNSVRGIVDDELESVWSRSKTPMEGVTAALDRGNKALRTMAAAGQLK